MSKEYELKRKHILCVNWYIFTWMWRKVYREIWNQSDSKDKNKKFRLESKFPIEVTSKPTEGEGANESNLPPKKTLYLDFYGLFDINHEYYDEIMHGSETHNDLKMVRKLSKMTYLYPTIFTGEECLIPINNSTLPKLYKYAEARFSSVDSYEYREESKTVDILIREFLYLPNMNLATAFIKSRGEIKPGNDSIGRNKAFLESTKYKELLRSDINTLDSYKKCLEEHLEKVKSCIIYNKNKNF